MPKYEEMDLRTLKFKLTWAKKNYVEPLKKRKTKHHGITGIPRGQYLLEKKIKLLESIIKEKEKHESATF